MDSCKFNRVILLLGVTFLELALIILTLALLPVGSPIQAATTAARSGTALQSSAAYTVYLPIVHRAPTPEAQLVALINAERTQRGLNAVSVSPLLMQEAEAHSQDMIDRNFVSHTNPDGQDPGDRLDSAGYDWLTYGENIGAGQTTAQDMLDGWMNSSGHRANLLNANFTEIGVGYVTGGRYGHYWTAVLARPAP